MLILNNSSLPSDPTFNSATVNTNLTVNGKVRVADGTAANPSIVFASDDDGSGTGFRRTAANAFGVYCDAILQGYWSPSYGYVAENGLYIQNGKSINFNGVTVLRLDTGASGPLQVGLDAATPNAQTLKAADGSGTDKNGASLSLKGGQSTGQGRGGFFAILTSLTSSTSNSTANNYSTRWQSPAKHIDLTNNANITILTISLSSGNYIGASLIPTIFSRDSTNHQSLTSRVLLDCINTGSSGISTNITQVNNNFISSISTGFLSGFYTVAGSGDNINIFCSGKTNLTPTIFQCKLIIDAINSNDVATVTEF